MDGQTETYTKTDINRQQNICKNTIKTIKSRKTKMENKNSWKGSYVYLASDFYIMRDRVICKNEMRFSTSTHFRSASSTKLTHNSSR